MLSQFEMEFPKGVGAAVDEAAKKFVEKFGAERLAEVSKHHFRTAFRAKDLPEPPKITWQRGKNSSGTVKQLSHEKKPEKPVDT